MMLILRFYYIGLGLMFVGRSVWSCSSKSVHITTTMRPKVNLQPSEETEKSVSLTENEPGSQGVWKAEGDRSGYMSSNINQHQHEDLSASPANGHNEDLLLKPLPTQDTGISDRLSGSLADDDENSSALLPSLSSNNHQIYSHKNNKPLTLVHFTNKSIQCNDKTTAGYYVRKSPLRNSQIWIVFLEGGWFCFDERSCQNRWLRLKNLMSSSAWSNHKHVGGILSPDPTENPYWFTANHVFVPYCSSDTWSGTTKGDENGSKFSFMGALIIDEVIKSLIKNGGLRADSTIVLAGSSAGGTGVLINLDRVDDLLNKKFGNSELGSPRVRGISDSGWFIDKLPSYSEKVDCNDVIFCPPEISLKKGMNLWNARLPENCQNSYPDEPWSCFFGYRIYPTLKASLFVFQWLFDEAQMLVNNVPTPALRKEEWDYVYRVGDELKKTLINVTNVFIPACMAHTVLTHKDWKRVEVNSVYLPRALKCWESGGIIEESNFIPKSRTPHRYWEDEEESSLPTNRRNPRLGNRISLSQPPMDQDEVDFSEVVNSNDSSRRNRRRHNRHKQRQSNKRERRKRRKKLEHERLEKPQGNRPPIPGVDFKTSPSVEAGGRQKQRQRKRHNANERPQDLYSGRSNTNANNNKQFRPSFNNSAVRKNISSNSNINSNLDSSLTQGVASNHLRNRSRKKHRSRRWFSVCDAAESGVEKCSWPQCNKSCPKLLNPLTGEEVDFKDLLKSFGLDMGTMAKALGIDLQTLNSMDQNLLRSKIIV